MGRTAITVATRPIQTRTTSGTMTAQTTLSASLTDTPHFEQQQRLQRLAVFCFCLCKMFPISHTISGPTQFLQEKKNCGQNKSSPQKSHLFAQPLSLLTLLTCSGC